MEDSPGDHESLIVEHGISFFIETENGNILFDTGQSDAFLYNAEFLNLSPQDADAVVISHGHYDHSGGFAHLVEEWNSDLPIKLFVGNGFFTPKYSRRGEALYFVGNRYSRESLISRGVKVSELSSPATEILPGVFVVTAFERREALEVYNPRMVFVDGAKVSADELQDEVALVLKAKDGIVLVLGCSHPGIINIINAVKERFREPIVAMVGGTHLKEAQGERLERAVDTIASLENTIVGVSHCTGPEATKILEERCTRFYRNNAGSTLIIE